MDVSIKKYKKDMFYSYIIGVYGTLELLKYRPNDVIKVFLSSKGFKNEGIDKIKKICQEKGIKTEVADGLINKISNSENTYAIAAFRKFVGNIDPNENHVVLVNPSDMGNVGSIIRTMVGFGVNNLALIRPSVDIFDPKVIRASQGAIFQISYQYFDNFPSYIKIYKRNIYTFSLSGRESLREIDFKIPYSLVFGNEGAGLPSEIENSGTSVKIPFNNKIDSLNLSVAVGIVLYSASKS